MIDETIDRLNRLVKDQANQIAALEHAKANFQREHIGAIRRLKDALDRIDGLTSELEKLRR